MAWKKIECGPPVELSGPYILNYIFQRCHICEECGEKTHWPGCPDGLDRGRHRNYPIKINGRTYKVRRVVHELAIGPIKRKNVVVSTCENERCISLKKIKQVGKDWVVKRSAKEGNLNKYQTRLKISKAKLAAVGKLTDEQVIRIRMDERPSPEVAAEFKCSESYVRALRTGYARKFVAAGNPFSGLMA
jgi:hypothetical protein